MADRWNRYWFPPTPTANLALARILAAAAQLVWFFPSLRDQLALLESNPEFMHPQQLLRALTAVVPRDVWLTPGTLTAIWWLTLVAGVLALIGLFTRPSLLVFASGIWFFILHRFSYDDVHHSEAVFSFLLMSLAFAPSGDSLSLDALIRRRRTGEGATGRRLSDLAMWPLKLAHVLLAMVYFSTGITKMLFGGLRWMNGYTLQGHTLGPALARDIPLGIWVAQQHTLAIVLSVGTVAFELGFVVSLFLPRWAPLFFLAGLLFQIGLHVVAGHGFFAHMTVLAILLICYDPGWWKAPLDRYLASRRRSSPSGARVVPFP